MLLMYEINRQVINDQLLMIKAMNMILMLLLLRISCCIYFKVDFRFVSVAYRLAHFKLNNKGGLL